MQAVDKLPILKMRRSLSAGDGEHFRSPKWLTQSHQDPTSFWRQYLGVFSQYHGSVSRARYGEGYDFYHDLVSRHQDTNRVAFVEWTSSRGEETLTYQSLHQRCRALEKTWLGEGVVAGDSVAIVAPVSVSFVVTALTALKLGLCLVPVPMLGRQFAQDCLDSAEPTWWVTEDRYAHGMKTSAKRLPVRPVSAGSTEADRSYFYAADEPVALVFSPVQEACGQPVEVTSECLYLGILRDAALGLCVDKADTVAAPGYCPIQFQPNILFSTLVSGATFLEVDETSFCMQTEELARFGITHLMLTPDSRDALLRDKLNGLSKLKKWFRNAHGPLDWGRWDRFSREAKSLGAQGTSYFGNMAAGGAILVGVSRPTPQYMHVLPVAGSSFTLSDSNLSGMPSVSESGILEWTDFSNSQQILGHQLMSRDRHEFVLIGPAKPHRQGQAFPGEAVVKLFESHPGVEATRIVYAPAAKSEAGWRAVAVTFIKPEGTWAENPDKLVDALSLQCQVELGLRAVPNKIEISALVAHHEEGEISQVWCDSQYLTGMLHRKAEVKVFRDLSNLRFAVQSLLRERRQEEV